MALSHSNSLPLVRRRAKSSFWWSPTHRLWTALYQSTSNSWLAAVGLNSLLKHYLTASRILMEQMAGSGMKQPFSSLKSKINWGRGEHLHKVTCSSSRKVTQKEGERYCSAGVDYIPLAMSMLLAVASWNPTVFTAKLARFYSFPHHPLSLFSLRISSGTFDCFLQCIRSPANFLYVWMLLCSISAFFCQDQGSHDLPAHVTSGAKCVYWSTVMDSEEHKHGAAIQSDLIETRQSQRRCFFHGCPPVWKSSGVSPGRISSQPHKSNDRCSLPSNLFWKCRSVQIVRRHTCQALLPSFFVTADLRLATYAV